jgi:hypothetical protein
MRRKVIPATILLLLAVVFHHAASAPIALGDTWRHWRYGEWIWEHKRLPEREPLDPAYTDQDKPFVDTSWLGEVIGWLVISCGGTKGVSVAAGIVEVLKTLLLFLAFRRAGASPWLALLGAALVQSGLWASAGMFRPQLLGELCGAAVLFLLGTTHPQRDIHAPTSPKRERGNDKVDLADSTHPNFFLPLVFILWANLDATFLVGLVWLALLLIGRVLEGKPPGRPALTAALCAAAVCVNPYGPRLIRTAVAFTQAQIQFAPDWQPPVSPRLPQMSYAAWTLIASVILVFVTLRLSPRRFATGELLLLLVFGIGAWFIGRLLPWWLMVCGWVLLPHWTKILAARVGVGELDSAAETPHPQPLSPEYRGEGGNSGGLSREYGGERGRLYVAAIAALVVAALLVYDGLRKSGREQPGTPVELAERLAADSRPESVRIFAPLYWSDYLLWQLPATRQLFLYNRFEVFRPRQLLFYDRILLMRSGNNDWRTLMDRAGIDVMALSAEGSGKDLFAWFLYNSEPGWQLAYVNEGATQLIAVRER